MKYPEFVESKIFYSLDKSKSEIEQLTAISEDLKKIHLLTCKSFDSFEELISNYLKAGIDIFQMETGIVSEIVNDQDYIIRSCDVIKGKLERHKPGKNPSTVPLIISSSDIYFEFHPHQFIVYHKL